MGGPGSGRRPGSGKGTAKGKPKSGWAGQTRTQLRDIAKGSLGTYMAKRATQTLNMRKGGKKGAKMKNAAKMVGRGHISFGKN